MEKIETAAMAVSTVAMADQIMKAIRDKDDHDSDGAKSHYVKAAIAGAIAVGAYEMLRHEGNADQDDGDHVRVTHHGSHHHSDGENKDTKTVVVHQGQRHHDHHHSGHGRDVLAEALGAYALGRQMMGHKDHRILKLVAEGLGAAALAREANRELD